jgi:hypothetical protein
MLAALVVLLGPMLVTSAKLTNTLKGLLALSVRHKKSCVCALACAVWRPLAWVYFRPPLLCEREQETKDGGEEEDEGEEREQEWEDDEEERTTKAAAATVWTQAEEVQRDEFQKVVTLSLPSPSDLRKYWHAITSLLNVCRCCQTTCSRLLRCRASTQS